MVLEESDRIDFTKLATEAVNQLHRKVEKSPVSPLMTPNNPHRQSLLRELRALFRKRGETSTVFVAFTTKSITVGDTLISNGPYAYEVELRGGNVSVRDSAASYEG